MICTEAADSNALLPSVYRIEQEETKIYELKARWHISACSGAFRGRPSMTFPTSSYNPISLWLWKGKATSKKSNAVDAARRLLPSLLKLQSVNQVTTMAFAMITSLLLWHPSEAPHF